ncbi:MAG: hypothetical protein HFP77_07240 [Methylococcales symbiont of Iophon sp. n. MRB-2018]|nr:MAG: hypothetical protein HFP77_07240 [Methylococcales symbiont of Iophon sp. n. MRB-2018]KAF3979629.1 MAG: hypothetical protein HFP76_06310 [Methylococcales symbiont of Iophon sp. n. MRB-2018]
MYIDKAINDDFQLMSESLNFLMSFRLLMKRFPFGMIKKQRFNLLHKSNKCHAIIKDADKTKVLYVEISAEKINTLLTERIICATDVRCLDAGSKYCLKELCLATCLQSK